MNSTDNFVTRALVVGFFVLATLVVGAYVAKVALGQAADVPATLEQMAVSIITLVIAGVGLAFGVTKRG